MAGDRDTPPNSPVADTLGLSPARFRPGLTGVALSFAAGIGLGWIQATPVIWPWIIAGTAGLILLVVALRVRPGGTEASILLLIVVASLGTAWVGISHHHVRQNDLAALLGDEPVLVTLSGVARTPPSVRDSARGSMAVFAVREPATYFRLDVSAIKVGEGESRDVQGQVLVKCDQTLAPFVVGSALTVTGRIRRFEPPLNPGEFNRSNYAKVLGQAGMLRVTRRELIKVTPAESGGWLQHLSRWRSSLRTSASGWLLSDLPDERRRGRDALLSAVLLGDREPDLTELGDTFRRVGLAHLLAISGLHLGIMAGLVLILVRLQGEFRPWHGWLLIVAVLFYLFLIEVRLPVLRAGVMTMAGALGLALGLRIKVRGLVALSAMLLLIWKPQQIVDAGFQLSYGVVLGLIHFTPIARKRWFGLRDPNAPSTSAMVKAWGFDALTASIVAWLIATPLVAHHFGIISPFAAIAGLIALPLVGLLLAVGYVKMLLGALLPSAALFLGGPLAAAADSLVAIVEGVDALPFSTIRVTPPGPLWTLGALATVVGWLVHRSRTHRWTLATLSLVLVGSLIVPALPLGRPALRIDMLSVGDGSCYILRSGGSTVVFDAGSSSDHNAGRNLIIPAAERLGVHSIDAIVVSHANLDHFSAVLEVVDRFDVPTVLLSPQFIQAAETDPFGPPALLVNELTRKLVSIRSISAGEQLVFGSTTWTWLHPAQDGIHRHPNDSSMVIRIEVADRVVLLTGDIQREAMAILSGGAVELDADILELPHHGSHHDAAEAFVASVAPQLVMQSTGFTRLLNDRWAEPLSDIERIITARDGACRVEIDHDGEIQVQRFRE